MSRVLPILFNTEMVRAILDGIKSVTRRLGGCKIAKFNVDRNGIVTATVFKETKRGKKVSHFAGGTMNEFIKTFSDYQPGDILYVRETWQYIYFAGENNGYVYKASENGILWETESENWTWRPSIHMPKEAARIWLKVKDVRVVRLNDISPDDAVKEGTKETFPPLSVDEFIDIWNSTIKKSDLDRYGWDANPFVWVIEFERCEKPENMLEVRYEIKRD